MVPLYLYYSKVKERFPRLCGLLTAQAGLWPLVVLLLAVFTVVCCRPGFFAMNGFTGPESYAAAHPQVRLTGDSWRYLSGGQALLSGGPLDLKQWTYLGYCVLCCLPVAALLAVQVAMAMAALAALLAAGRRLGHPVAAWLGTALFAIHPEFAAWHTAVMTESVYTSAVCIGAWLALRAVEKRRPAAFLTALGFIILTAFLRPTGWIQLPAVLLFWTFALVRGRLRQIGLAVLIVLSFVAVAVTRAREGIQVESPVAKLYAGEVVWQEDLWRVPMPSAEGYGNSFADGIRYGLCHPVASARLVLTRLGVMFLRIRPSYSTRHNLFLMAFHLPVALLGLWGLLRHWRQPCWWVIGTAVLSHALVVALTFNDNDGRFTLYFTPLLALAAVQTVWEYVVSRLHPNCSSQREP